MLRVAFSASAVLLWIYSMEILLHIGSPKTATKSIQRTLRRKREILLRDHRLYVPPTFMGNQDVSHWLLNVGSLDISRMSPKKARDLSYQDKDVLSKLRNDLRDEIRKHITAASTLGADRCVFSNEGLFFLSASEEFRRLRDFFSPHAVSIVVVFRDRNEFLASWRKQLQKMGFEESSDPDSFAYTKPDSWLLDYDAKRQGLIEAFGGHAVTSIDYMQGQMVSIFFRAIGISDERLEEAFENVTPS